MKVRFLFTRDAPLDKGRAVRGMIVVMRPSEAALYSRGGFGRILKEGEGMPKGAHKPPAASAPRPPAKPRAKDA